MTRSTSRDQNAIRTQQRKARRMMTTTALAAAGVIGIANQAMALDPGALPTGEQVVGGGATFDRSVQNQLDVHQSTQRAVINWDSFNIGANATTQFYQPNSSSLTVNRVVGNSMDPSQILGSLKANGQLMILDRNGVLFGAHSRIDVGGIVASTGDVDTNAVMRGDSKLTLSNFGAGSIVNEGEISVSDAGLAAFVAPTASNSGTINAKIGKVVLAGAGGDTTATVDLYGDGLVELAPGGNTGKVLAQNSGTINAEGGTVVMTAAAAKGAVDDVINMSGVVKVSSVTQKGGEIILDGGNGKVKVSGTADASGTSGGTIKVTGSDIVTTSDSLFLADAFENGDGGNIRVVADNSTLFSGSVYARGGVLGGNGGFVEISGDTLGYDGFVNTLAENGISGSLLFDPHVAVIHSGSLYSVGNTDTDFISAEQLASTLKANGTVNVQATDKIDVGTNTAATNVGTGDIDLSTGATSTLVLDHYEPTDKHPGDPGYQGKYNGCNNGSPGAKCVAVYVTVAGTPGITAGNLYLQSGTINFNKNLILGTGTLTADAATVNLNGKIYGRSTVGGATTLLGDSQLIGVARLATINILSPNALINQGINFADDATALTTVNVAAGTYDEDVVVNESNVLVKGAANNASVITPHSPGFHVTGNDDTVDGFAINGGGVVVDSGALNATIENNVISNSADEGILVAGGANNATLSGNKIHNTGKDGIAVKDSTGAKILNNEIGIGDALNSIGSAAGGGDAIFATNADGATIQGNKTANTHYNGPARKGSGILVTNSDHVQIGGAGALGNDIALAGSDGIVVRADGGTADFDTIEGNTIHGAAGSRTGIYTENANNIAIRDNIVSGTGRYAAIYGYGGSNFSITGNVLSHNDEEGILLQNAGGDFNIIDNNKIDFTGESLKTSDGENSGDAIRVKGASGLVVVNNKVGMNGGGINGNGLSISSSDHAYVAANKISGTALSGIVSQDDNDATIQQNIIDGAGIDGIYVSGGTNVTVGGASAGYANTVTNSGDDGIEIDNVAGAVKVAYNTIDTTGTGHENNGIELLNLTGAVVDHNNVSNTGWNNINVVGSNGTQITNNIFDHSINASGIGIWQGSSNSTITGNTITNAQFGMWIGGHSGSLLIDGNTVKGMALDGIYLNNGSGGTISNNTFDGMGRDGVSLENIAAGSSITGNFAGYGADKALGNADDGTIGRDGVHLVNASSTVSGNFIAHVAGNGVFLDPSDYSVISGNTMTGGNYGVYSDGNSHVSITGNTINSALNTGIFVQGGTANSIDNNDVYTPGNIGIYATLTDAVSITNNRANGANYGIVGSHLTGVSKIAGNILNGAGTNGIAVWGNAGTTAVDGNTVKNTGSNGLGAIEVDGGQGVTVSNNKVIKSASSGVYATGSKDLAVTGNFIGTLDGTSATAGAVGTGYHGGNGVTVENGTGTTRISGNTIDNVTDASSVYTDPAAVNNGVSVKNTANATVDSNKIGTVGAIKGTGVKIDGGTGTNKVTSNIVANVGADGIAVAGTEGLQILSNKVGYISANTAGAAGNINGDGIYVTGSDNASIKSNKITETHSTGADKGSGIQVVNSNGVTIGGSNAATDGNTVTNSNWDGIRLQNDGTVTVRNNTVDNVTRVGIYGGNVNTATVSDNIVKNGHLAGYGEISFDNGSDLTIQTNKVSFGSDRGIQVIGATGTNLIDGNKIDALAGTGIYASNVSDLTVNKNQIGQHAVSGTSGKIVAGDGIDVLNSGAAQITGNVVSVSQVGIFLDPSDGSFITGNTVDGGTTGIYSLNNSDVTIGGAGNLKNTVKNTGADGIRVDGGSGNKVLGNSVTNAHANGIRALDSNGLTVAGNTVTTTGADGILVNGGDNVTVGGAGSSDKNTVTGTAQDGIHVEDTTGLTVQNNVVYKNNDDGIDVTNAASAQILSNAVGKSGSSNKIADNGIEVTDSASANVSGNSVTNTGANGIFVDPSPNAVIAGNTISDTGANGIYSLDNDNVTIGGASAADGNTVTGAGANGILVSGGGNALIQNNTVKGGDTTTQLLWGFIPVGANNGVAGAQLDGIRVENNNGVNILNNTIAAGQTGLIDVVFGASGGNGASGNGIAVYASNNATIDQNAVNPDLLGNGLGAGLDGIHVENSDNLTVGGLIPLLNGNKIFSTGGDGIHIDGSNGVFVLNNIVSGASLDLLGFDISGEIGGDGIDMNHTTGSLVAGNIVTDTGSDGIRFANGTLSLMTLNLISNAGANGIDVTDSGLLALLANDVTGANDDGIHLGHSYLTLTAANTVSGSGDDGIDLDKAIGAAVLNNTVSGSGDNGIEASRLALGLISGNTVSDSVNNGIDLSGAALVSVQDNDVTGSGHNGINALGMLLSRITGNTVSGSANDGIALLGGALVKVDGNDVDQSGRDGIDAAFLLGGSIDGNTVKHSGHDGIALNGGAFVSVDGNDVARSHHDGIAVNGLFHGSVDGNDVKLSGKDGIGVEHALFTTVDGNRVTSSDRDGIALADDMFVTATGNTVKGAGRDGIHADHDTGLKLKDNTIRYTDGDGIDVRHSDAARIVGNNTAFTSGDGIQVRGSDDVKVSRNTVRRADGDGIYVENSDGARIRGNDVARVGENGIEVYGSNDVRIVRNDVTRADYDGINVVGGNNLLIKNNTVSHSGDDGIYVAGVGENGVFDGFHVANGDYAVRIIGNTVSSSGWNGIEANNDGWTKIGGNTVLGAGEDGIFVTGGFRYVTFLAINNEGGEGGDQGEDNNGFPSSLAEIVNNTVDNVGDNGIEVANVDYSLIARNKVGLGADGTAGTEDDSHIGNDGIRVGSESWGDPTFIQNNLVSNATFNGIEINGVDEAHILSNVVTNSGANGFFASGPENGSVVLAGNTFTGNTVGAKFESGLIDLTGDANTFNGGEVGMLFAPFQFFQDFEGEGEGGNSTPSYAHLELAKDTAGIPTIGTSIFKGQSKYYVQLDNGAFFDPGKPTILNGLNATYDGFSPASTGGVLTKAQYNAIEAKIFHYVDDRTLGLFFFGAVPESGSVDQKDIFRVFGSFAPGGGGLSVTITGLPNVPGGRTNFNVINTPPTNVANIEPAAGGDDDGSIDVTGIEPAAGTPSGKDNSCWGDAIQGAGGGTPVSYSFAFGDSSQALSQAAGCQSGKL